jgi:hypothetical protein
LKSNKIKLKIYKINQNNIIKIKEVKEETTIKTIKKIIKIEIFKNNIKLEEKIKINNNSNHITNNTIDAIIITINKTRGRNINKINNLINNNKEYVTTEINVQDNFVIINIQKDSKEIKTIKIKESKANT